MIKSWHFTVEFELRRAEHFATGAAARARVAAWIEDYTTTRRHPACSMVPPVTWEPGRRRPRPLLVSGRRLGPVVPARRSRLRVAPT